MLVLQEPKKKKLSLHWPNVINYTDVMQNNFASMHTLPRLQQTNNNSVEERAVWCKEFKLGMAC